VTEAAKHGARSCDIVVVASEPYLFLDDTIERIRNTTKEMPVHITVVQSGPGRSFYGDGGDGSRGVDDVIVVSAEGPLSFLDAVLSGASSGESDFVVTVPAGALPPPHWLEGLIDAAETSKKVGAVRPLSNACDDSLDHTMVQGITVFEFSELIGGCTLSALPTGRLGARAPALFRRSFLDAVIEGRGGDGVDAEVDLNRLLSRYGYHAVLADNIYMYVRGSADGSDVQTEAGTGEEHRAIRRLKRRLFRKTRLSVIPSIHTLEHTSRAIVRGVVRPFRSITKKEAIKRFGEALKMMLPKRRFIPRRRDPGRRAGDIDVVYVIDRMILSGGALVVVEIVNEMILQGIRARIATLARYPETRQWECLSEPIVYRSRRDLINNFPAADIAVATFWKTAPWVRRVADADPGVIPVYFLQDYEAWFYPEDERRKRSAVFDTYDMMAHKIVTTEWLSKKLSEHGHPSTVIPIGIDTETFRPGHHAEDGNVIVAMARPSTSHRGFDTVIETMRIVTERMPEARIILFGDDNLSGMDIPFPFVDAGVIGDRMEMARLYSGADLFFDGSDFQGFGRPALEAMDSGLCSVLTDAGGVTEYARDEANALLVPPKDPERAAEAICRLISHGDERERIAREGRQTAETYANREIAKRTLDYFQGLLK